MTRAPAKQRAKELLPREVRDYLTGVQQQVLMRLEQGRSIELIAADLHLPVPAVKLHVVKILEAVRHALGVTDWRSAANKTEVDAKAEALDADGILLRIENELPDIERRTERLMAHYGL